MPVLGTKLRIPAPRRRLVARDRLLRHLEGDEGSAPRLVLVSAPAGFGKTTLLTQWLTAAPASQGVAWLSLDASDSEPRRFLTHLVAALQHAAAGVGEDALALLDADRGRPSEDVVASLVNDLDAAEGAIVLAFDDYHVVSDQGVHEVLASLLEHLPPQVTVAMTTRADPPLPLARMRARGELLELRATDLRFTPDEAEAFLNHVMDLGLASELVAALESKTEGWAAGLQMAALSARGRPSDASRRSVEAFVGDFAGSHRYVLDYLLEEVLAGQPGDVRAFLLDTSVLEQLTATLCDAVSGRTDGQRLLDTLDRDNVFVVCLDDQRQWFRYHHLFADALRARLLAEDPDRLPELHRRASLWYAAQGSLAEAIAHAFAADDSALAADLVELDLPGARRRREDRAMREWLRALPDEVLSTRPLLASQQALARLSEGDADGAAQWLESAADALGERSADAHALSRVPMEGGAADAATAREAELRVLPAQIAVYHAALAQARGDIADTVTHARRALELAGPTDYLARSGGAGFLGLAAWAAGDLAYAVETFTEAVEALHAGGNVTDELGSTVVLGQMWWARGRPDEARRLYEEALRTAGRQRGPVLSTVGDLHVGLAEVLREANDLQGAAEHLDVARDLGERASLLENRHRWFSATAGLLLAQGDLDGAAAMLEEAEPLYLPGFFPDVHPIAAAKARVRVLQGRLEEAWSWARDNQVTTTDPSAYLAEYDQLTLVRLFIAEQRVDDALALLGRILASAEARHRDGTVVEVLWLRAVAHHSRGDLDAALDAADRALELGVRRGFARLFLDEGTAGLEMLEAAARGGVASADASRLLAAEALRRDAATGAPSSSPSPPGSPTGLEPLSERELEVLRLLATDLTGPEIASRLFMSINTFRTHSRHIFTKLDVNTRRAAVARATEAGLL